MVPQSYLTYTGDHLSVRLICLIYKDVSTKFAFKIQLIHLFYMYFHKYYSLMLSI